MAYGDRPALDGLVDGWVDGVVLADASDEDADGAAGVGRPRPTLDRTGRAARTAGTTGIE